MNPIQDFIERYHEKSLGGIEESMVENGYLDVAELAQRTRDPDPATPTAQGGRGATGRG